MKLLSNLRILFMIAAASFMLVSCGEDGLGGGGVDGGGKTPLSLSVTSLSETTVAIGEAFTVNLIAELGDDSLRTIQVFEDDLTIADFSRISYGGDPAASNPVLLLGESKGSVDVDVSVIAHTEVGTRTYTFTVTDDLGDSESRSIEITTVGTPPALTLNGPTTLDLDPSTLNNISLTGVRGSGAILLPLRLEHLLWMVLTYILSQ